MPKRYLPWTKKTRASKHARFVSLLLDATASSTRHLNKSAAEKVVCRSTAILSFGTKIRLHLFCVRMWVYRLTIPSCKIDRKSLLGCLPNPAIISNIFRNYADVKNDNVDVEISSKCSFSEKFTPTNNSKIMQKSGPKSGEPYVFFFEKSLGPLRFLYSSQYLETIFRFV